MNKILLVISAILMLFAVVPDTVKADADYPYRNQTNLSTWLWDTSEIVDHPDMIIRELLARNVKLLLLQIDTSIDVNDYREFITKATAGGIKVSALDGAPEWATEHGAELQQAFISWLGNYQQTAPADGKFVGMHIDVEPYELDDYESNANQILETYQAMIIQFQEQASRNQLEFGIDIPFWFYGVRYSNHYGSGTMAEWLCQHVKNLTIMAYRDKAGGSDGILAISAAEMKLFRRYGVNGTIAVETGRLSKSNAFVTFYEEGETYMNQQLEQVYEAYKSHSEFAGIAIHHFDSWLQMK